MYVSIFGFAQQWPIYTKITETFIFYHSVKEIMANKSKLKVMKFKVLAEKDEDGYYVADVPELQGCHTQAKNQKELMKRVKEVITLCQYS